MSNIPLESLHLSSISLDNNKINELMVQIAKLKSLEDLLLVFLRGVSVSSFHIPNICKHNKKLLDLCVGGYQTTGFEFSSKVLLEIVKHAKKLQILSLRVNGQNGKLQCIDAETYIEMAQIVRRRHGSNHSKVYLSHHSFTADIPAELIRSHNMFLTVKVVKFAPPIFY